MTGRQRCAVEGDRGTAHQTFNQMHSTCTRSITLMRAYPAAPGGRAAATQPRSQNLVLPASPMGAVALLHWRVTGVALLIHRELGRGRHRHQPGCRHRSCASRKPTRRGPRRWRAERDSRRSPWSGECCIARWWQRARWWASKMGERRQYTGPRRPHLEHQDVRWPSPATARQDRRESVRPHAWSRRCERSRRRRPDRAAVPAGFH